MQDDEYLDIVDNNDKVIGKELRSKVYSKGLPKGKNYRCINVLVFNSKGELLLPKRSMNRKNFPGTYDFSVGEHVQSGENYKDAAIRGLKEELGIGKVKLKEVSKIFLPGKKVSADCFVQTYSCVYHGKISSYDKEGIDSMEYLQVGKILEMIHKNPEKFKPHLKPILERYNNIKD